MAFWRDLRLGVHLEDSDCPEPLVRPCLGPQGWIVGKSAIGAPGTPNKSRLWKWNGAWEVLSENCVGAWSGAIDYAGRAVWIERRDEFNDAVVVREPSNFGSGYEILDVPYQSAGIRDILPDNTVVMDDGSQMPFRRSDGSQILIPKACVRGDYIAGYASDLPGGIGVVVGRTSTGQLWRVSSVDPQSLPVRLDDDGQTVAVSGTQGGFVPAANWTEEPFQSQAQIVPLIKPTIFAAYVYAGTRTFDANGTLVPGQDLVMDNGDRYAVIDIEQGGIIKNVGRARCITGTFDSLLAEADLPADGPVYPNKYDAGVFVQCCPTIGESASDQAKRYNNYLWRLAASFPYAKIGVISFVRTNFQLSDDDIRNGMVACSALGCPVLVFEDNRPVADVPAFVPDLLKTWRNGQPAPKALPYPTPIPPTPQGLAARKILL